MNPSFEQLMACPNNWFQADTATHWSWLNTSTLPPNNYCKGTLVSNCCTNYPYCTVPDNWTGYQYPKTGNSYMVLASIYGLYPSTSNKREYLKGQLSQTLQAGKKYCLTFYYNATNTIIYATNRFGAYVDDGVIGSYNCCKDINIIPQAENNPAVFMTDTMNWVKIQNSFTAIGNENTITLGNFVDSSVIQFQSFNSNGQHGEYYNIDDVSLIPMDLQAYAGRDTSVVHGDSTYIGRPNEVGLNDDCVWYFFGNAIPIDTVAGMWVKPNTTTSYVVEQNICGMVTYDTIMVSVVPTGIKQYQGNYKQVTVYPNPATNKLFIKTEEKIQNIEVYDVLGANLISTKELEIDVSKLNAGVYFVEVLTSNYSYTSKFIKE